MDRRVRGEISKVLAHPEKFPAIIDKGLGRSKIIIISEYIAQIPNDTGAARSNVRTINIPEGYRVTTRAVNEQGKNYMVWVHNGTLSRRGGPDEGRRGVSRIRSTNNYGFGVSFKGRQESAAVFAALYKQGKLRGIRPNRFADRTVKRKKRAVVTEFHKTIKKEIGDTVNV